MSPSERKAITLREISVQTLIETEGQTCFAVFAGLRVFYSPILGDPSEEIGSRTKITCF